MSLAVSEFIVILNCGVSTSHLFVIIWTHNCWFAGTICLCYSGVNRKSCSLYCRILTCKCTAIEWSFRRPPLAHWKHRLSVECQTILSYSWEVMHQSVMWPIHHSVSWWNWLQLTNAADIVNTQPCVSVAYIHHVSCLPARSLQTIIVSPKYQSSYDC